MMVKKEQKLYHLPLQVQGEGRTEHTVDQHHRLPPLGLGLRTQNPAGLPGKLFCSTIFLPYLSFSCP